MLFSAGVRFSYIIIVFKVSGHYVLYPERSPLIIICWIIIIASASTDTYQDRKIDRTLIDP